MRGRIREGRRKKEKERGRRKERENKEEGRRREKEEEGGEGEESGRDVKRRKRGDRSSVDSIVCME